MTYLCVPIFFQNVDQAKRDVATAIESGADAVELRTDATDDINGVLRVINELKVETIVTRRPTSEGGLSEEPQDERIRKLFRMAGDFGANVADVELAARQSVPVLQSRLPDGMERWILTLDPDPSPCSSP